MNERVEVNCLGTKKFELLPLQTSRPIRIWSEKQQRWTVEDCLEYETDCSICKTPMLVRAIKGTTYLALCSETCYQEYDTQRKTVEVKGQ